MTVSDVLLHDEGADYVKYAKQALTYPSDFAWFGSDDMFVTWGFAGINKNGMNHLADISNWECTIAEIKREFGEDVYNENFLDAPMSHWAVGSCNQLCVRILNREVNHDEITAEDITPYFRFVANIALYLAEEYPILDDSHYSELQWQESSKDIEDSLSGRYSWFPLGGHVNMIDGLGDAIQSWICDNCNSYYDVDDRGVPIYSEEDIVLAVYDLGLDKNEDEDDELFWNDWKEKNMSAVTQRKNRRLEEAGQLKLEFS